LRKERVVLNRRRIVQPKPIIEKTHKKIDNYNRHTRFRVFTSSSRFGTKQSAGAKAIAVIRINDEVHKVETVEENLLLGDEAE
jgi:hypothetical protein